VEAAGERKMHRVLEAGVVSARYHQQQSTLKSYPRLNGVRTAAVLSLPFAHPPLCTSSAV